MHIEGFSNSFYILDVAVRVRHTLLIDSGLVGATDGRGATRAEDAQGTPTQSHTSPSIQVYEHKPLLQPHISQSILVYEHKSLVKPDQFQKNPSHILE